ncbi:MAG: Fe-S-cluster containining protein [Psychromonas sp.]|jgi:Fe-S-cluster containining protein
MKYSELLKRGQEIKGEAIKFFKKNKLKGNKLDKSIHSLHDKAFKKIDCLSCANCCKTTSPIFRDIDIKRISKHQKSSEKNFIRNYLHQDDEGDYVLNSSPCTFLNLDDNTCNIYDVRPLACRGYPHTDRKNMHQILDLTVKNLDVCPAVANIVDNFLKENNVTV